MMEFQWGSEDFDSEYIYQLSESENWFHLVPSVGTHYIYRSSRERWIKLMVVYGQ